MYSRYRAPSCPKSRVLKSKAASLEVSTNSSSSVGEMFVVSFMLAGSSTVKRPFLHEMLGVSRKSPCARYLSRQSTGETMQISHAYPEGKQVNQRRDGVNGTRAIKVRVYNFTFHHQ